MREGVDVVYQATLEDDGWSGRVDFLRRVDVVRCRLIGRPSCGLSIVETESSSEAYPPPNVGVRPSRRWWSLQELVVESLVVSLAMVVFSVLVDETTQMPLAERDHACETLLCDRPDEPLGIGVRLGLFGGSRIG